MRRNVLDEAYFGPYSDTQYLLLGFNETDVLGLAAIISNDGENPNTVNFTMESSTDISLNIWMGEKYLNLEVADSQVIIDFFTALDTGQFQ